MNGMKLVYVLVKENDLSIEGESFDKIGDALQALLRGNEDYLLQIIGRLQGSGTATLDYITLKDISLPNSIKFIVGD